MGTDWLHERRGTSHVLSNAHSELLWQELWGDSYFKWKAQLSSISSSILRLLWLLSHTSLSSVPEKDRYKGSKIWNSFLKWQILCLVYIGHQFFLNRNDVFKLVIVNCLRGGTMSYSLTLCRALHWAPKEVSKVQSPLENHYGLWGKVVITLDKKFVNSLNQRQSVKSATREACKTLGVQKRRLIPVRGIWKVIMKEVASLDLKEWEKFQKMGGKH